MITELQLQQLQPGDKVHRSTWRPHPCGEFEVVSSREANGRFFVFATCGPRLDQNPVISAVNSSGFHLAALCPHTEGREAHAAAVNADLDRMQAEQSASLSERANL